MSNDEYQHQNNWIDIRDKHKQIFEIVCKQVEKEFTNYYKKNLTYIITPAKDIITNNGKDLI